MQKPKADAAKTVGMSYTLAMKHRLNADAIPNLASETKIGINYVYLNCTMKIRMNVPKAASPKEIEKPKRAPILKYIIPLTISAINSDV